MGQYRRKPILIEAQQLTREAIEAHLFDGLPLPRGVTLRSADFHSADRIIYRVRLTVTTIHGQQTDIVEGDWVLPESDGEHFYPCKPDIFEATYDPVEDGTSVPEDAGERGTQERGAA